jgi:hypothetical protein
MQGRDFMPVDRAGVLGARNRMLSDRKSFHALRIQMNFAMLVARETLEKFGKSALRAVAAVNEG